MSSYDELYTTMLRMEEVICTTFQLDGNIDESNLPMLKGWNLDGSSNELWKKDTDKVDKEIDIVKALLESSKIKYGEPKEYLYIRIYPVDDPSVKGVDWLEDQAEYVFDYIDDLPYYKDEDGSYWQYKKTSHNVYEYEDIELYCEAYQYFKEQQRIEREGVGQESVVGRKKREFDIGSVIVKTQSITCQKEHTLEELAGQILVLDDNNDIQKLLVPVTFCYDENVCFMLDVDYEALNKYGRVLCKVVDYHNYEKHGIQYYYDFGKELAAKSVLNIMGYTVGKKENLTAGQRQKILCCVIENSIMNKYEVVNFLRWCYKKHHTAHPEAAKKYLDDIQYLQYTNIEMKPVVEIDELVIK